MRRVICFRNGISESVRSALIQFYQRYIDAILTYAELIAKATGHTPVNVSPMKWFDEAASDGESQDETIRMLMQRASNSMDSISQLGKT